MCGRTTTMRIYPKKFAEKDFKEIDRRGGFAGQVDRKDTYFFEGKRREKEDTLYWTAGTDRMTGEEKVSVGVASVFK
jgi:hypothetical protein